MTVGERARFLYRAYRARWRDQRAELGEMLRRIRPGDTVADIGAHKGAYLYWMRRAAGPAGRVLGFEPQPALHAYVSAAVSRFGWTNVEVLPFALSDQRGTAVIHVPGAAGATSPGASLEARPDTHPVQCTLETLDHLLSASARVSFIKCDVEGHELAVLRGARRLLAEQAPALLLECEARHLSSHGMDDVFGFLAALGYQGGFFGGRGLVPLARFDAKLHQDSAGERFWDRAGYFNNFLFFKA